jgi:hypothetical protein
MCDPAICQRMNARQARAMLLGPYDYERKLEGSELGVGKVPESSAPDREL